MPPVDANIARHLALMAERQPDVAALKIPRGRGTDGRIDYLALTFAELDREVDTWAACLTAKGVRRGDRTLVMVRQGLPLIAAAFALFRLGAVPVIIDPGMGRKTFLTCVERSRPRVLLGIPLAQIVSHVFRKAFRTVAVRVRASSSVTARLAAAAGPSGAPRAASHEAFKSSGSPKSSASISAADDLAAVLFTSGSTGAPKGVCYTHGMFAAQVELIRATYGIQPGEIDLPMLPIFALFNPALGMTTIVPEIDPSRPAAVDPAKIVQAIRQENVTNSFGSPTLWRKIADHCQARGETLPSMKRVLCAGAPVPPELWETLTAVLPAGKLHSPYGATEALPVSTISADEVIRETAGATQHGAGTCVGRPLAANQVRIIALADAPIATLADARELPAGEIGEIIVAGPTVTQTYDALEAATAASKIRGPADRRQSSGASVVWHRMGDCGYLDAHGRLWFCGRKAERIETLDGPLFTEQIEPIFAGHKNVRRCALIGLGARGEQTPAIVVEPTQLELIKTSADCRRFARELREIARRHEHTARFTIFYFHEAFPVDVRHNAKIHRLTLTAWAQTAKGYQSDPKR